MTGEYAENAAEAAGLDIIARYAVMQENTETALDSYLSGVMHAEVKRVLGRRIRLSDDERLQALVAVARASAYPLHEPAYRETFAAAKSVRNLLAHGGTMLPTREPTTGEPGLMAITKEGRPVPYSLRNLLAIASDARWLATVSWRISSLHTGEGVPRSVRVPSDVPVSSVIGWPSSTGEWPSPPVCPNGHGNVVGVETRYGSAWRCGHCDHVRLLDDASLSGPRATLTESSTPRLPPMLDETR